MRTKELVYDGQNYTIAPLTLRQAEELAQEQQPDLSKLSEAEQAKIGRARAIKIVCYGLNNALKPTDLATSEWTRENCADRLDQWMLFELMKQIIRFTNPDADLGESAAAPDRGETALAQPISSASAAG